MSRPRTAIALATFALVIFGIPGILAAQQPGAGSVQAPGGMTTKDKVVAGAKSVAAVVAAAIPVSKIAAGASAAVKGIVGVAKPAAAGILGADSAQQLGENAAKALATAVPNGMAWVGSLTYFDEHNPIKRGTKAVWDKAGDAFDKTMTGLKKLPLLFWRAWDAGSDLVQNVAADTGITSSDSSGD